MEAVKNLIDLNQQPPYEALEVFFSVHTPDSVWEKFFHLLKAWANQPNEKKQYTDEKIALFLDQLTSLVAAASTLNETNKASLNLQEDSNHG